MTQTLEAISTHLLSEYGKPFPQGVVRADHPRVMIAAQMDKYKKRTRNWCPATHNDMSVLGQSLNPLPINDAYILCHELP